MFAADPKFVLGFSKLGSISKAPVRFNVVAACGQLGSNQEFPVEYGTEVGLPCP